LLLETADPELAALVRHGSLRGRHRGGAQGTAGEQASDQKQRDHRDSEAEIGQGELGQ